MTKKKSPEFTFPNMTTRVFADLKHKTLVPSPDAYFKEERTKTHRGELRGAAFGAANNSEHKFYGCRSINGSPSRFDEHQPVKDSMKPAPTSY